MNAKRRDNNASRSAFLMAFETMLQYNRTDLFRLFVEHGADANIVSITYPAEATTTALHLAVESGSIEFVRLLLEAGARVNV